MEEKEKLRLRKFIDELKVCKGRHTELISVYVPAGYNLSSIAKQLEQEKSTAKNIKSTATRKNVMDALEKLTKHLKLYKKTPANGLALFCGNISKKEGQVQMELLAIEPPQSMKTKLYRCDQEFLLDPLVEMLAVSKIYGLLVIEKKEATIGLLEGKSIKVLQHMTSGVPGKTEKGGQCLASDSLIMKSDGEIIEIRNAKNPQQIRSIDFSNYGTNDSPILDKWESKKQVLKIRTKNPCFEIEASNDHLFFLKDGEEKVAEELKVGDYLLFPEKIRVDGKKQKLKIVKKYAPNKKGRDFFKRIRERKMLQRELAKELGFSQTMISKFEISEVGMDKEKIRKACGILGINYKEFMSKYGILTSIIKQEKLTGGIARILGYFMGDGNYEKNRICFSEANKKIVNFYTQLIQKIFGLKPAVRFREKKNYYEIRVHSKDLVEFMKSNFPELKGARNSEIPRKILRSEDKVLSAFLSGFFDAEGYVSTRIGLGISNKKLAKQLQLCLLRLGIISSFVDYSNKRNPYSKNHRYTTEIFDKKSLQLFLEKIGFIKNAKIKGLIKKKSFTDYTRQVLVDGGEIKKLFSNHGEINASERFGISSFLNNRRMISKGVFKRGIVNNIKNNELKEKLIKIMKREVIPVKINSIAPIGRKETVDISVKNQNFIANGLVVHNSAARFARIRENLAKQFYKRIAEILKREFFDMPKLKGILIGGPGPTKEDFLKESDLVTQLREKILAVKDIGYADEHGLDLLVEASGDVLAKEEITEEKNLLEKFFILLASKPEKVCYGIQKTKKALEYGAAEKVLVSTTLKEKVIKELEEKAKNIGAEMTLISIETEEGVQFRSLGGVGAFLRFSLGE